MTYPDGVIDKLRARGMVFEGDSPSNEAPTQPVVHEKAKNQTQT